MSTDAVTPFSDAAASLEKPGVELRTESTAFLSLVELDPRLVVEGTRVDGGFEAKDVIPVGKMRETCPYCLGVPLQLVLRFQHVLRPHLFCEHCTRCFDANFADGNSALMFNRPDIA